MQRLEKPQQREVRLVGVGQVEQTGGWVWLAWTAQRSKPRGMC